MADIADGATVTFVTNAYTGAAYSNITLDPITREIVGSSHLGTTGGKTFLRGVTYDPGGFSATVLYDPDEQPPWNSSAFEVIRITYKLPAGQSTAAKLEASGAVDSFTPGDSLTLDGLMTATLHVKWSGNLTFTDSVT